MKRVATVLGTAGLLAAGVTAAVALGAGSGVNGGTVSTTTTNADTTAAPKVWLCHHTGSWKHPYHLIRISGNAVAAHRRHGDVDPGAGNSCPTTQPAGAKQHGKSGEVHGQAGRAHGKSAVKSKDDADPDDDSATDGD